MIMYKNGKFYNGKRPLNRKHNGFTLLDFCEELALCPYSVGGFGSSYLYYLKPIDGKSNNGPLEFTVYALCKSMAEAYPLKRYIFGRTRKWAYQSFVLSMKILSHYKFESASINRTKGKTWVAHFRFRDTEVDFALRYFELDKTGFQYANGSVMSVSLSRYNGEKVVWHPARLKVIDDDYEVKIEEMKVHNLTNILNRFDLAQFVQAEIAYAALKI